MHHQLSQFRALDAFSINYILPLGFLSVKYDLIWFEHNCYLSTMFRIICVYFVDSDGMLFSIRFDICDYSL
jgi:hypothetical protein